MKNYGLLPPVDDPKEYQLGGTTGIVHQKLNTTRDWRRWTPTNEHQNYLKFDDFGCTQHSGENSVGMQLDFHHDSGLIRIEDWEWLKNPGYGLSYIDANGKINFDDRWCVVRSGNTPGQGNTLAAFWELARTKGLPPQGATPFREDMTEGEYYSDKDFPAHADALATEFKNRFLVQYERVTDTSVSGLTKALEHAPVHMGVATCPPWNTTDVVKSCGASANHAIVLACIDDVKYVVDSYEPNAKRLAKQYAVPFAYKGIVVSRNKPADLTPAFRHSFTKDLKFGDYDTEVAFLIKALQAEGCMDSSYTPTPHYGPEVRIGVFNFQIKYGLAKFFWDVIYYRGTYFGPKTRQKMNIIYG